MIPIPQYPIYSALIALLRGERIGYELVEEKGWCLDMEVSFFFSFVLEPAH